MPISIKKKKRLTNNDLNWIETKLQKVKKLHSKINQFKLKLKEFKYEKEGGNADDILNNI